MLDNLIKQKETDNKNLSKEFERTASRLYEMTLIQAS